MSERAGERGGDFWDDADETTALQRYRTLVNTIDDGLYQLDADGTVVAVNDVIVDRTGYARDELIGHHVSRILDANDIERIEREIQEGLSADRDAAGVFEVAIETADGDRVPTELRVNPLLEDGEFRGTIGVARDVSDLERSRERAETAMESYETITTVLDEADVGVFLLDDSFDVAWADETAGEYFGFDRDAVIGRDKRELIDETIRHRVADGDAFADTVLATYEDNSYDERFDCRVTAGSDGGERWLEHRSRPIESGRYAGGRIELYYDVTDRHRRATQLRRLNVAVSEWLEESSREGVAERATDHLRDILGMTLNGIYLYDDDATALRPASWTDATERLLGDLPTFEPNEGVAWHVFESGEPAFYADVSEAPNAYDPDTPIGSEMVLPIGDHGVAFISSAERGAFDEGDRMLAQVVASSLEATFDRLRHERRLERERDLIDRILDTIPVGGFVLDADGEITRINDRAAELFGVEEPESFSPEDGLLYDEDGRRLSVEEYPSSRALETGEPIYDRVLQVERPGGDEDGERRWLSISAAPIADDGATDRVVTAAEDVTDLKERERALESELREVFGRVSDAFYAVDEEYRFTHVNERAAELLGVPEDELLGRRLGEVYSETAELEQVRDRFDEAMETQESTGLEHYSDLLGFWIEATVYPSESGVSVYFRDVTERKEREQELRESEAKFRTLAENLDEIVWMSTPDAEEILYINPIYEDVWGRNRDSLYDDPHSFLEAIHPDDRARVREAYAALPETEYDEEFRVVRPDGSVRWVHAQAVPVRNDGEIVRIVGVAADITDRREYRRKLETSERRHRTLVENFPDGAVALYDEDLEYTAIGGQYFDEVGIDPDERLGNNVSEVYPDRLVAELEPEFRAAFDGEEREFEVELNDRYLRVHVVPVENAAGEIYAGMIVAQDITERRAYRRKLEESNERLQQFAYAVSHDLQEPLRMITSYLQLLESRYEDELDEDAAEFIDFAVDGADRMKAMIEGLLEYSRVTTRGDPLEPVDLERVVDEALADLQFRIEDENAEIETESLPRVEGDINQLRQVFQNLLDNAIEYSGDEPPRIEITAERRESGHAAADGPAEPQPRAEGIAAESDDEWVISVADEGIGIDPEDADRIFEVFERLHTREEHAGTGIGLALCQRIVERHGGEIWIDSEPGEGATFSFTLPAVDESDE
ncbi:PAS domain S-box protein [Haloterrigena sp. SYSU A558-1]|uniref:histidine kinase n=1 Tax=Haloterrigena gelatinilytica TaxID=2741724 RepID=A0ABX2L3X7_9EURY|nr:PAS domain S-box protein [Haloterrigena gelatinilytica]NUC70989.1 PAS domain S-box protein [Haloterrigena gelatinilytica]